MKVFLVTPGLLEARGSGRFLRLLEEDLKNQGHTVEMFFGNGRSLSGKIFFALSKASRRLGFGDLAGLPLTDSVSPRRTAFSRLHSFQSGLAARGLPGAVNWRKLVKAVRSENAVVILSWFPHPTTQVPKRILATIGNHIWFLPFFHPEDSLHRWVLNQIKARDSLPKMLSLYEESPEILELESSGICVTLFPTTPALFREGIPPDIRAGIGLPQQATYFVVVGPPIEKINPEFIFQVAARLPSEVHLVCLGEGWEDYQNPKMVGLNHVSDLVYKGLLSEAAGVLLTSSADSLSFVALDALANGLPIVATSESKVGTWIVRESKGGVLADGTIEVGRALEKIASSPEHRRELASNGFKWLKIRHESSEFSKAVSSFVQKAGELLQQRR